MTPPQIKTMQQRINDAGFPLVVDGFWGPKSNAACKDYLRSLMPSPNPWPKPDQSSLRAFFGEPGDESELTAIEFPYPMFYDGNLVKRTRCNKKIAPALSRVFDDIKARYSGAPAIMAAASDYYGCFNFRVKRGGSSYSLHAYGAAIDIDADDNGFKDSWPVKADMPLEIMECFARQGFKSAGAFWNYDAMHHEATS